tara:strand:+ start:462 stop:1013 length:552 start_codon:yes stop_codon:yes gene_type:complete
MILDFHSSINEDEEWYDNIHSDNSDPEMITAVKIQDKISTLQLESPITAEMGTNLKNALNLLQQKQQNCLIVTNNDKIEGILTERDILLKVTGKGFDLDLVTVDEFMTSKPECLSEDDPIAYALNKMHIGGFRHVPIVDDGFAPVSIISISDIISIIADYFSMEIINLPPLDRLVDSDMQEGG